LDGPADLDWRGSPRYLYIAIPARNVIAVVTRAGSLVRTFAAPGSRPTGCCGYGFTMISDSATHTIYENGRPVITGLQTPVGIDENFTVGQDGYHWIWVVEAMTNYIYEYELVVGVEPASFGRVKALFR
jgi:hypothetical protein